MLFVLINMEYKFTKKPFCEIKIDFVAKNNKKYTLLLNKNTVDIMSFENRCLEHSHEYYSLFGNGLYLDKTQPSAATHIINILHNEEIIASCSFNRRQYSVSIDFVYVAEEHRKIGLSTLLIEMVLKLGYYYKDVDKYFLIQTYWNSKLALQFKKHSKIQYLGKSPIITSLDGKYNFNKQWLIKMEDIDLHSKFFEKSLINFTGL